MVTMTDLAADADDNNRIIQRTLYRLYYVENRRVAEVGKIIGLPEGTVKYRLYELRRALRLLLDE